MAFPQRKLNVEVANQSRDRLFALELVEELAIESVPLGTGKVCP